MKIYDVSLPVAEHMVTWPGDPIVSLKQVKAISKGDNCNVTKMQMGIHTGTHIDAPYHFIESGGKVGSIPMESLIGACLVIEVDSAVAVSKKDLIKHNISGHTRILIKTKNSGLWKNNTRSFNADFIALGIDAAEYLAQMNVILIGIDYLSIESSYSNDNKVHKTLLGKNIIILEGLDLSEVKAGLYELICLPLKLQGCEGSPARVILREIG